MEVFYLVLRLTQRESELSTLVTLNPVTLITPMTPVPLTPLAALRPQDAALLNRY